MDQNNRRTFLKDSAKLASLTFAIGAAGATGRVLGANDRVRIAVAGINGRGKNHIESFGKQEGVEIAYLADPDSSLFESRRELAQKNGGHDPKTVQDIRMALDDANVDAVSIATPNHWHSLMTIWACEAGKDVYVEKPLSHNVHEGRIAVETARKHNRIVQHGTQSRSSRSWWNIAEHVKKGTYGKLLVSRGLCYKPRNSIGYEPQIEPPKDVSYDLWLGPAPEQPYHENLVHYNWHWFWDFGNGDIGNQGVHQMDIARWMIPGATLPNSVLSVGGRFGYKDQGETANTQIALMDFGGTKLIFEVRGLKTDNYQKEKIGNILHFEDGVIAGDGKFYPKGKEDGEGVDVPRLDIETGPGGGHFENFTAAVRSRKTDDLNAEILEGHYSSALCHLANIPHRMGGPASFKNNPKPFGKDSDGNEAFVRMKEHLADTNHLPLDDMFFTAGAYLKFAGKKERFTNSDDANLLLTRHYREPYVVPDHVA